MKSITVYDEKYNDVKIEIVYADHALTRDDVKILVLKHYGVNLERAKKEHELLGLYQRYIELGGINEEANEVWQQINQLEEELK